MKRRANKVDFVYKCSDFFTPGDEYGETCPVANTVLLLGWNDPDIGIDWPMTDVLVSDKDKVAASLSEVPEQNLPLFE